MCGNMIRRASSSISVLNVNRSFSALARIAAGRALIVSNQRFRCGIVLYAVSPRTNGTARAQPHAAMSTIVYISPSKNGREAN